MTEARGEGGEDQYPYRLNFKKRTIVFRASAVLNSRNGKEVLDINLFFADKLPDGRLGVIANAGKLLNQTCSAATHKMPL